MIFEGAKSPASIDKFLQNELLQNMMFSYRVHSALSMC